MSSKTKVFFVGTHGVPAKYGGFETLADYLCQYLSGKMDCTVYCSGKVYTKRIPTYFNAKLVYLPFSANGFSGIIYDVISLWLSFWKADVILYLGPVGSGFFTVLNVLFKKKLIINHGGLNEWEREKLSWIQRKYAKMNHRIASKQALVNIVDNLVYKESLRTNFNADSVAIRYGGDHVKKISVEENPVLAVKYPFVVEKYAVSVSRAQVDNNLHLVLDAFSEFNEYKLVLISNWSISNYGKELYSKYKNSSSMILLDAIYDKESLDFIRGNAYVYIHSHSRCGTAPSLVEAMSLGKAIISFDVLTNRETTKNQAYFFSDKDELVRILSEFDAEKTLENGKIMSTIASQEYTWSAIARQYQQVIEKNN